MAATVLALTLLFLTRLNDRRLWLFAVSIAAMGFWIISKRVDLIFGQRGIFDRFGGMLTGQDRSGEIRMQIYRAAIDQFTASPILGDGVEVRTFAYYPHNLILEAFMTTGIVGGMLFIMALLLALHRVWRLFKVRSDKIWLGLIVVQYAVATQLSGAIYLSNGFWVLLAGVLSIAPTSEKNQPRLGVAKQSIQPKRYIRPAKSVKPIESDWHFR